MMRIPLVHEDAQLLLIFDLDQLLAAIGRLGIVSWLFVRGFGVEGAYEGDVLLRIC